MGMRLNLSNLFQFITYIIPFLLIFTFILIGFLNNEPINSIMYVGAVTICTFLIGLIGNQFNIEVLKDRSAMCDLWDIPFINSIGGPSLTTYFITFSSIYMLLPMFMSGSINYGILLLFIILLVSDIVSKLSNKCTSITGIMLSIIFGVVTSGLLTTGLYHAVPDLMFFTENKSNKVMCGKPTKKKFKCSVYKNGQLLKEL
jgi:hypothetical protein